ncbi:hypothetical protein BDA96_05G082400 [Sorghum bicolor]|uniref:Uncharacterized protein n=2 Tax=Sorghum bicolor TaxID=4558 RepID=A0A1Z5RHD1_SORBI|nr:hypothetical protein BDA96_05G082400 [Sorghum bicolor]OQU83134.1 hypothetical protein SORBI_3005G081600 [Sorghum bicolor]
MLDEFSSCLVLTFSTQFPKIGDKHLDMLSFLLECDVPWMGLVAQHFPILLTSVHILLFLAPLVQLERPQVSRP